MVKPRRPTQPKSRSTAHSGTTKISTSRAKPKTTESPSTPPVAVTATSRTIPRPPPDLNALVKKTIWSADKTIHRIHPETYGANTFNPGPRGNARFSPIIDANGISIPTIYGGTTLECAAMETVFHDVPHEPGLKTVAKRKLKNHQYSQLQSSTDLTLADLSSTALRKLGIPRVDLIETDKDIYPQTRKWAEAIHAQCPDVQGLEWVSRQDDRARAIILFGDRLPPDPLSSIAPSVDIVENEDTYAALVELAETIGVQITGK
ncbi:RES family NAD+ phosphorylase [Komagataeibacter intermedius]|uniref:RES family NAD+ phosphorylase n=1 Tax=Acetobacteraceae TaxID=433 RepID=UPI0007DCF43F|nr:MULTISPECIES: RES family NAD+ phosphorylase [Komagataeibacter]MCF3635404.1 RES family NAD+ phosphorylase [Komagataeibacter intermedius]SAY50011.1 RES domain protein [Komagataeibacter rhaeticus]